MNNLNFSIPVKSVEHNKTLINHFIEFIDDFCSSGSKQAYVIPGKMINCSQEVVIVSKRESSNFNKILLTARKIALYLTIFFPLIAWTVKVVWRISHKYHVVSSKSLLQKEIPNSQSKKDIIHQIEPLMGNILKGTGSFTDLIHIHTIMRSSHHYRTECSFSIKSSPNLTFYLETDDKEMEKYYEKIIFAKTVCRIYQLDHIVIPNVEILEIEYMEKKYKVLSIDKMDIEIGNHIQEKNYHDFGDTLDKAINQLTISACKTGFEPDWEKIPVLNHSLENGNRKIVLTNFHSVQTCLPMSYSNDNTSVVRHALFGKKHLTSGLVSCVNEKQAESVIKVAKKQIKWSDKFEKTAQNALKQRKAAILDYNQLMQFYSRSNIVNGSEPISVNDDQLDFSGNPDSEKLKLLTRVIINGMNELMSKSSSQSIIKEQREFQNYKILTSGFFTKSKSNDIVESLLYDKPLFEPLFVKNSVKTVLDQLKALGLIYSYTKDQEGFPCSIQA